MSDYTLQVSDAEVARYRTMAGRALEGERDLLTSAGVVHGATVVDVGCGPAAFSVVVAELVGPAGQVIAIERNDEALAAARQVVAQAGVANVELRQGDATATAVDPGSADVVMMRHVLAHNGGHEADIVAHLASLARPGGHVYVVDVDLTASRQLDLDPDLDDVIPTYVEFHRSLGNDLAIGIRLGRLLEGAGLTVTDFEGRIVPLTPPSGVRPPAWAARDAMVRSGVVTDEVVARWSAAFDRMEAASTRATVFLPQYVAIGRRPD
jgi:SAM-dependent methyltransferase